MGAIMSEQVSLCCKEKSCEDMIFQNSEKKVPSIK